MATQLSILSWRIPWTEEPGRLQSRRSQRIGHDLSDWAHTKVIWHLYKPMTHVKVKLPSRVWLFATTWTVTDQAPPSMGFSRQEYRVGCPFFLQGIFPIQGLNLGLPHRRQTLYYLSYWGSCITSHIFKLSKTLFFSKEEEWFESEQLVLKWCMGK